MAGSNNARIPQTPEEPLKEDPLGVLKGDHDSGVKPPLSPPMTPSDPPSYTRSPFMAVTYCSTEHGQTTSHTALIPRTTNYDAALESANAAFQRYLPTGSTNRFRWLSARVQLSSGSVWADITPQVFSSMITDAEVELRLCEEAEDKLDVSVLPIGHNLNTSAYYDIKVITIGSMSVGKSMMHQFFTKKEEQRRDTLPSTLHVVPDITNRLMTAQGELVRATLWDTAGQERFHSLTQSHYRRAHGVFLVYSIADPRSFKQCTEWLSEIRANVDETVPIMLIGNQVDRSGERVVQTSQGQRFALQHALLFTEISAKCGTNVDYAFRRLVHDIFNGLKNRGELDGLKKTKTALRVDGPSSGSCSSSGLSSVSSGVSSGWSSLSTGASSGWSSLSTGASSGWSSLSSGVSSGVTSGYSSVRGLWDSGRA